jgi:FlaA1/EpsC-like NDP-sugar epimerase
MLKNNLFNWQEKEILIIGGTGSLGKQITKTLIDKYKPKGIRIYSRDEFKQWGMKIELEDYIKKIPVSFLIGDIRDRDRLKRAMERVDVVFNAAAMKQVPACEENPLEACKTNVTGSQNVIDCALDCNVDRVMHISTDKAVEPVNLYGATKTVAEKLFIHSNVYSGNHGPKFSCCRYGNVINSRGSVIPLFQKQAEMFGEITITDINMTRFFITLERVAKFIIEAAATDLAKAVVPDAKYRITGVRKGEKLHEILVTPQEKIEHFDDDMFIVSESGGKDGFYYSSYNDNIDMEEIKELIKDVK